MNPPPSTIYLQWDGDAEPPEPCTADPDDRDVTWCRDRVFARDIKFEAADRLEELERELTQWQTELSKVMPPDFKDWWQNSKAEWPLVARLVIEGKNRERAAADEYTARIERELAESIELRGFIEQAAVKLEEDKEYNARLCDTLREELAETAKDYHSLTELLDGHDATECRANLVRLKADLATERALADRLAETMRQIADGCNDAWCRDDATVALASWKEARHE